MCMRWMRRTKHVFFSFLNYRFIFKFLQSLWPSLMDLTHTRAPFFTLQEWGASSMLFGKNALQGESQFSHSFSVRTVAPVSRTMVLCSGTLFSLRIGSEMIISAHVSNKLSWPSFSPDLYHRVYCFISLLPQKPFYNCGSNGWFANQIHPCELQHTKSARLIFFFLFFFLSYRYLT